MFFTPRSVRVIERILRQNPWWQGQEIEEIKNYRCELWATSFWMVCKTPAGKRAA
jgi:hypothetical protein